MMISGPAGALESILQQAGEARAGRVGILCHPHPQYGGSMHDAVVDSAAAVLRDAGIDALRFNFRGVGASDGSYDGGAGEVDDLLAVAGHARAELGYRSIVLIGYSFGSRVSWGAAEAIEAERTILIAPPIGMMEYPEDLAPRCPLAVIIGSADDFADQDAVRRWCDLHGARLELIPGANHFFAGAWTDVTAAVGRCLG